VLVLELELAALLDQLQREILERGKVAPALVELPAMQADEAVERAHATGACSSATSWA
jgi:hypothetical protein